MRTSSTYIALFGLSLMERRRKNLNILFRWSTISRRQQDCTTGVFCEKYDKNGHLLRFDPHTIFSF